MTAGRTPTALVVVESMFGNTDRIARAVAEGLVAAGVTTEVLDVASAPVDLPPDVSLLVVGAPTHAFSLSRPASRASAVQQGAAPERATIGLREWLGTVLPQDPKRSPVTAVFDTRVSKVRRLRLAAGPRAAKLARRRGLVLAGAPAAFLVADVTGPLLDGEVERAVAWGRKLAGVVTTASGERSPR